MHRTISRLPRVIALTAICSSLFSCVTASAQTLYGGNVDTTPNLGGLQQIDQTTGAGTLIGAPVPGEGIFGLAFSSLGTLYATSSFGASSLITVDPATGGLLSTVGTITDGIDPLGIADLAVRPGTDTLFGLGLDNSLYTINTTTALATFVASLPGDFGAIAFDPSGNLWLTTAVGPGVFNLDTIDPVTGAVLTSVSTDNEYGGLAARPTDGLLFAAMDDTQNIVTLSPGGVSTFLGPTGAGFVGDLAFSPAAAAVPEPGSCALSAGVAIAALFSFRRRRHCPIPVCGAHGRTRGGPMRRPCAIE